MLDIAPLWGSLISIQSHFYKYCAPMARTFCAKLFYLLAFTSLATKGGTLETFHDSELNIVARRNSYGLLSSSLTGLFDVLP